MTTLDSIDYPMHTAPQRDKTVHHFKNNSLQKKSGKKIILGILSACLTMLFAPVALAADQASGVQWPSSFSEDLFPTEFSLGEDTKLKFEFYNRTRGQFYDWFGNLKAGPSGAVSPREYAYSFVDNKLQFGARLTNSFSESFAQLQDTLYTALPSNGIGPGANYYQPRAPETTQNSVFLRQAWSRLHYQGFFLTGGRLLYSDGAQGTATHKTLKWIQDNRIAQRLIGPNEWTGGRSFDGGILGYSNDSFEVSGFGFVPTWGSFETDGMPEINGISVAGATLNLRDTGPIPDLLARLSYYNYNDSRTIAAVDNSPKTLQTNLPINIHTIGGTLANVIKVGPGNIDSMVYAFGQVGQWRNLNQAAWAYGAEFGYQLTDVWGSPWLRVGVNSGSGDSNPNDNTHGTFFQMIPTARLYAQFPFYNMMNNQDVFVQAILKPHSMVTLRVDFHSLSVNSTSDLVYAGGGASNNTSFGYTGLKTYGYGNLAYVTHATLDFKPLSYLGFQAFYGHAFGQDILNANYTSNQGNYAYLEAVISF